MLSFWDKPLYWDKIHKPPHSPLQSVQFRVVQPSPKSKSRTFLSCPPKMPFSLATNSHSPRPTQLLAGRNKWGTGWMSLCLCSWLHVRSCLVPNFPFCFYFGSVSPPYLCYWSRFQLIPQPLSFSSTPWPESFSQGKACSNHVSRGNPQWLPYRSRLHSSAISLGRFRLMTQAP